MRDAASTALFIDGRWCGSVEGGRREIRCAADSTVVGVVDEATEADTSAAIAAAREAFDHGPWSGLSAGERGALLARVVVLLERDKDKVARAESLDTGKRLVESEYDVDDVVSVFRHFSAAVPDEGRVIAVLPASRRLAPLPGQATPATSSRSSDVADIPPRPTPCLSSR